MRTVALGGEADVRPPAATDIQEGVAFFETDFPADQVELGFLRIVEGRRVLPVAAARGKPPVVGRFEDVRRQIVVGVRNLRCATYVLAVADSRAGDKYHARHGQTQILTETRRNCSVEKLIERCAIPLAVHVGLTHTQRAPCDGSREEPLVAYLGIP